MPSRFSFAGHRSAEMWTHKTFPGPFRGPVVTSVYFYKHKDLVLCLLNLNQSPSVSAKLTYIKGLSSILPHAQLCMLRMVNLIQLRWRLDTSAELTSCPAKLGTRDMLSSAETKPPSSQFRKDQVLKLYQ